MLVLSRKTGESFMIGDDVTVTVMRISGNAVRIGITARDGSVILRRELLNENREREAESRGPAAPGP